ncbi:WecA-like glycosyltransferase [Poriferisphaera corsica]|uniref:WecA-like glycosyltransferase n=1 Tax=Poriferisphaera corsica TaxID=2528020 RepID=A0A517YQB6_9BACT|nr:MraY family glycosyltransferase [Poriferisphaera corsica]QDU32408.1 WecA-like glycosyltransferase [Poriferisphaera corsica]
MIWICLSFIAISFLIGFPILAVILYASRRVGLLDQVGLESHKRHQVPVPNTGGLGIFWAVAIPMILVLFGIWIIQPETYAEYVPQLYAHLPGLRSRTSMGGVVLIALAVLHLMGIIDDRKPLGPYIKLAVQLSVSAALVIVADMRVLQFLETPELLGGLGYVISIVVSIVWFTVIINAFNMLDNMDGLSAGVAMICTAIYLSATIISGQWFVASLAAMLLGALLAFLCFNFPPAKMFMGDGGSLVIGMLIGVLSVRTTYFDPASVVRPGHWYGVLMPLMILAIPLYDFVSVTLIRLAQGRSPFTGDHQHFSHRLVAKGLSRRAAVLIIWLCTVVTGLSGIMLGTLDKWQAILAAINSLAVIVLLAILEHTTSRADRLN